MELEQFLTKKFMFIYFTIFVLLYIFCTFISFLGRLPILLIITFFITYYMTKPSSIENS